jgi:hypothetical protein
MEGNSLKTFENRALGKVFAKGPLSNTGNEPSGFIKCCVIHELLSDWRLLKKD